MFIVQNKVGKRINLLVMSQKEIDQLEKQELYCPTCHRQVNFKNGKIRVPHFAHTSASSCPSNSASESYQHLALKKALFYWFSKVAKVEVEVFLPQLNQRPDLLVNDKLVIEVQCSLLSTQRLKERTQAYQENGYIVCWLLGESLWLGERLTALKQQFLYYTENIGFYYWELDLKKRTLRLNYMIHEDIIGRLHYLVKAFNFGESHILEVLRIPYRKRIHYLKRPLKQNCERVIRRQLYYKHPKWLQIQEVYYRHKQSLLGTKKLKNRLFPVGLNSLTYPFEGVILKEFYQIKLELLPYYRQFIAYHSHKSDDVVYSPNQYLKGRLTYR